MSQQRTLRTAAGIVGLAAGLAGSAVGALAVAALRRPLPRTSGALRLPGLAAPVQVLRDRWGVPHIYAESAADLFRAQGFAHGQDRLWQMEFNRRLGHGRLSELVGPVALDTDRYVRTLGLGRVARREAEQLPPDIREVLEAYAAGVNAAIEQSAGRLPVEFTLLRVTPEPWRPADTLVWAKVMALTLSSTWTSKILRARLVAAVGAERAAELEPEYLAGHPLIVPPGVTYGAAMGEDALGMAEGAAPFVREGGGQGSNNWVVGGARTASGRPLLANDPHLSIAMPSIWYENHLSGGGYHVAGASFPGCPGVVIGHNERIAWGVTNGMNDVQDLYVERFDRADPSRYLFRGAWEQAEVIREEIRVKGRAEPHVERVRVTRHGPVVSPLVAEGARPPAGSEEHEEALALRWTALEADPRLMRSLLGINRATDWASFRAAVGDWHVPAQNFVYADVDGHIGYALGGDIPVRARGDGRLPVPGWTGEYEWAGVVPAEEMPHAFDPPEGFALSANNRIVGEGFPHVIPGEYLNGYRAARIRAMVEETQRHTPESFARMHMDRRSLPGIELAALAGRLPAETPAARAARDALAAWDGDLTADSVAGTIYAALRYHLLAAAAADSAAPLGITVGAGAFADLPGQDLLSRNLPRLLRRIADRDGAGLPPGRTWDSLLGDAWLAALAELRGSYGDDVSRWVYGRDHRLTVRHALGAVPALGRLLNRGPFPTGGDIDTVCMGNMPRAFAGAPYYTAPSYRQILDVGDWNRSRSIHPTGQSGHPASGHYADFVQPWLNGEYHPMPWGRAQVEEATEDRLTLTP